MKNSIFKVMGLALVPGTVLFGKQNKSEEKLNERGEFGRSLQ